MTLKTHSGMNVLDALQPRKMPNGALSPSFHHRANSDSINQGTRFLHAQLPPDLDLEGGTLMSVEEVGSCLMAISKYICLPLVRGNRPRR